MAKNTMNTSVITKDEIVNAECNQMLEFDYILNKLTTSEDITKADVIAAKELDDLAFMYNIHQDILIELYKGCAKDIPSVKSVINRISENCEDPADEVELRFLNSIRPNWRVDYAEADAEHERLKAEEQLEHKENIAEVTEEKEEKTMTNAPLSMSAFKAQIQANLEETKGVSFAKDAAAPKKFAQLETLGLNYMEIEKIEYITLKYEANEDKGKNARFVRAWKITLKDETIPPIIINDQVFLYDGDKRVENIDIYDAIVNGAGNIGVYFTVKEDAIKNKKAEELTPEDLIPHELNGQRIWRPAKQELIALAKQLQVAELDFNDDESIKLPKDFKAAIYVYEDVVTDKIMKQVKDQVKQFQTIEYYYNASFIKPEDIHDMKYGRRFTTSKNAAHRAELETMPGVVRYLESC